MAEERNTGLTAGSTPNNTGIARAPQTDAATDDTETTKEELQRRMETAREHISQTVAEIKDTVTTQYDSVRTSINENLDWREHVRKRPTALSIAAGTVGFFLGYAIGGSFGGRRDDDYDYTEYEYEYDDDDDTYSPTVTAREYRAQTMSGMSSDDNRSNSMSRGNAKRSSSPSYASSAASSSYDSTSSQESASSGPGMFEKFKGTAAFDKLTNEISTLGNRVVDELSHTAQTVVLPMVLGKLKDAVGIDLNMQKKVAERSNVERQTSAAQAEAISSNKDANKRSEEQDNS